MIIYEQIFKKYGLSASQQKIIQLVGEAKIVLEIGASTGYMTRVLLQNRCQVDVVEIDQKALNKLPKSVRKIINYSIEDGNVKEMLASDYDFIILADVLEHLVNPEKVLKVLRSITGSSTKLLISVPNIASWPMRKQLFFNGDFEYQESGTLDKTHLHFYTVNTLPKFLKETGWEVDNIIGTITRLPFEESINKVPVIGWFYKTFIRENLASSFKNLAYYHFLVVASK